MEDFSSPSRPCPPQGSRTWREGKIRRYSGSRPDDSGPWLGTSVRVSLLFSETGELKATAYRLSQCEMSPAIGGQIVEPGLVADPEFDVEQEDRVHLARRGSD